MCLGACWYYNDGRHKVIQIEISQLLEIQKRNMSYTPALLWNISQLWSARILSQYRCVVEDGHTTLVLVHRTFYGQRRPTRRQPYIHGFYGVRDSSIFMGSMGEATAIYSWVFSSHDVVTYVHA